MELESEALADCLARRLSGLHANGRRGDKHLLHLEQRMVAFARRLLQSHVAQKVAEASGNDKKDSATLAPGLTQLYSYYKPGLSAADYTIEVKQSINAETPSGHQSLQISNTRAAAGGGPLAPQEFTVVVPRFSLDRSLINSYYPPDGHQDEGRILPHIVLNDPHYPWEIPAGTLSNMKGPIDPQKCVDATTTKVRYRNMVPWVALLVFDVEDLYFDNIDELKGLQVSGFDSSSDLVKQNANGYFTMSIKDYFTKTPSRAQVNYMPEFAGADQDGYNEIVGSDDPVNVIFPRQELIKKLVGQRFSDSDLEVDVQSFKYLSHVRRLNVEGSPEAVVGEQGYFSVVLSARTGPVSISKPTTQICHLVSIENLDVTIQAWENPNGRVGMVSLFSWIYTALPPNPVNFVTTVRSLMEAQQMLRVDKGQLKKLEDSISVGEKSTKGQVSAIMAARLRSGYTMARWRTQTGEETAAFNRGPLVPHPVPHVPAKDLEDCSNTSQEYQILDPETGLMDLSYSSAWQAGKLLAISDTNFSSALMRLRSKVHNTAASTAGMVVNGMVTQKELLRNVVETTNSIKALTDGQAPSPERRRLKDGFRSVIRLGNPVAHPVLLANVSKVVEVKSNAGESIYNDFNPTGPNDSDWATIHNWMAEKLLLGGIPMQYFVPEPSYLPRESLRFFFIDDFWLDCLIDGALSVANHLDKDDDATRREIKRRFNVYLSSVIAPATVKPQIPSNGFIIRSNLIKAMPDLKVNVSWLRPDDRYPFCRWTRLDDETLMCLLDRPFEELDSITLEQPPHQQRFSLGSGIDIDASGQVQKVNFDLRRLYTAWIGDPPKDWPNAGHLDGTNWYDAGSRGLKLGRMAKELNEKLQYALDQNGLAYVDDTPNSCEFGLELNDPAYYFAIKAPNGVPTFMPRDRQLWVKGENDNNDGFAAASSRIKNTRKIAHPSTLTSKSIQKPSPPAVEVAISAPAPPSPRIVPTPPHAQPRLQPAPPQHQTPVQLASAIQDVPSSLHTQFSVTIFADYKGPPQAHAPVPTATPPWTFFPPTTSTTTT